MDNLTNPIFWGYVLAGCGLLIYALFFWMKIRGIYVPSARFSKIIGFSCLCFLLAPFVLRYQYSEAVILYLSAAMVVVGVLIKFVRGKGI